MKWLELQILVKESANTRYKTRKFTSLIILKEPEGVAQAGSVKKLVLEFSQINRQTPVPGSPF